MKCETLQTAMQLVVSGSLVVLTSVVLLLLRDLRKGMKR